MHKIVACKATKVKCIQVIKFVLPVSVENAINKSFEHDEFVNDTLTGM